MVTVAIVVTFLWVLVGGYVLLRIGSHRHDWSGWEDGALTETELGYKCRSYNSCRSCGHTRVRSTTW